MGVKGRSLHQLLPGAAGLADHPLRQLLAFPHGGQTDEQATAHLDAMNKIGGFPWPMTYSYGRALQAAPQRAWGGKPENTAAAQREFLHRARMNSLASQGQWDVKQEKKKAA